jgi:hypothetical protein
MDIYHFRGNPAGSQVQQTNETRSKAV